MEERKQSIFEQSDASLLASRDRLIITRKFWVVPALLAILGFGFATMRTSFASASFFTVIAITWGMALLLILLKFLANKWNLKLSHADPGSEVISPTLFILVVGVLIVIAIILLGVVNW